MRTLHLYSSNRSGQLQLLFLAIDTNISSSCGNRHCQIYAHLFSAESRFYRKEFSAFICHPPHHTRTNTTIQLCFG